MKKIALLLLLSVIIFSSCTEDTVETALFAVPKYKSLNEIRDNVNVLPPRDTNSDGKIYVASKYLFYIAQEEGIHVFDNSNPSSPNNIAFIRIEGVHDIAVKGNYLFADNFFDLLVFDISNISNISLEQTVENVISFYPLYPTDAEYYDYEAIANAGDVLVGYELVYKEKPDYDEISIFGNEDALAGVGGIGTGGSYAKFQIRNDALYTLENWKLNIFNITNPTETYFDHDMYLDTWVTGQFETLFIQKENLFIGSTNGMYIIDVFDEFNPLFVSEFIHATACDPVVVHQDTAYITIRGSSTCGAVEDQVNAIDISNINQPTLTATYFLDEPYGLGYRNNTLYVCSDTQGLAIFDTTDAQNLVLQRTYNFDVSDVIPLDTHLIAVGYQKIIQFNYLADRELEVISQIDF